jgi:altronate hydrolase
MNDSPSNRVIRLNAADNVVIAAHDLPAGCMVSSEKLVCRETIPAGHKVASAAIAPGARVIKYGQVIGAATAAIQPGMHVHTHNLGMHQLDRTYQAAAKPPAAGPQETTAFFQGIVRPDGRVATRNFIGVMATAGCSAEVVRLIAAAFDAQTLAAYPHVDGVLPIIHGSGCGLADYGEPLDLLQRTLAGWIHHPNFAGILLVGLGCEINLLHKMEAVVVRPPGTILRQLEIQACGGTRKTIDAGVEAVRDMLSVADQARRSAVPAAHLIVGLECGGSDGFSGISANPALGVASDMVVRQGGTAVLSETTEIYGAEQLLIRRATDPAVAEKLLERIRWWETYTQRNGVEINNNPGPGNKAGGLTTILEKSLGAVAKSGSSPLRAVVDFAEPLRDKGLVFMDTPGYDIVSVTGLIAGGANIICFTTGRGSIFGSKPAPTLKLASNSPMYQAMADDMDINCGRIVDGETTVEACGRDIFQMILDTASGAPTRSERLGLGELAFTPWPLGAIL